MDLSKLTTQKVLQYEEVGGVISTGVVPVGLTEDSTLDMWKAAMPMVDEALLETWFNFAQSRIKLVQLCLKHSAV